MKHKYQLLICVFFLCLYSCKKETQAAGTGTLIVGKWYFMKQVSVLYQSTKEISTFTKTNFTNDDFIEYYNDGSGYYSKSTAQGPSLSEFTYKISGGYVKLYPQRRGRWPPGSTSASLMMKPAVYWFTNKVECFGLMSYCTKLV